MSLNIIQNMRGHTPPCSRMMLALDVRLERNFLLLVLPHELAIIHNNDESHVDSRDNSKTLLKSFPGFQPFIFSLETVLSLEDEVDGGRKVEIGNEENKSFWSYHEIHLHTSQLLLSQHSTEYKD